MRRVDHTGRVVLHDAGPRRVEAEAVELHEQRLRGGRDAAASCSDDALAAGRNDAVGVLERFVAEERGDGGAHGGCEGGVVGIDGGDCDDGHDGRVAGRRGIDGGLTATSLGLTG